MLGPTWTLAQREARLGKLVQRNRSHRADFLYENEAWMRNAYLERGLTLRQIADEANCGLRTIARWMETHGIETRKTWTRPRGPDHPNWKAAMVCPKCGGHRSHGSRTCNKCRDIKGAKNPKWRGDNIEYGAVHNRLVTLRGKPSNHGCEHCDQPAEEWAYDHQDPNEKRNTHGRAEGPYSTNLDHYMPLCKSCHRSLDLGRAARLRSNSTR